MFRIIAYWSETGKEVGKDTNRISSISLSHVVIFYSEFDEKLTWLQLSFLSCNNVRSYCAILHE